MTLSQFLTLTTSQPFIPEGTFKVEEARLEALKVWSKKNQEREEERVETEEELEGYIVSRAKSEAAFWEKSLVLLDLQCKRAEAELIKAQDRRLDELLVRKATADAERAEHERDITATSLTRKAKAEADKAELEVEFVKNQTKKLQWEIQVVQVEVERVKSSKALADAQTQLAIAQTQLAIAQTAAASAAVQPAPPSNAPPTQAETKDLLQKLEKMDPCSGGYAWVDKPDEGGFRCEGGSHFKSYAEARAFTASKKK